MLELRGFSGVRWTEPTLQRLDRREEKKDARTRTSTAVGMKTLGNSGLAPAQSLGWLLNMRTGPVNGTLLLRVSKELNMTVFWLHSF